MKRSVFENIIIKEDLILDFKKNKKSTTKFNLYLNKIKEKKKVFKYKKIKSKDKSTFKNINVIDFNKKIKLINQKKFTILIHPDSIFNKIWNYYLTILIIIGNIFIPYYIAFTDFHNLFLIYLELTQEVSFILDIIFSFITAFEDKHNRIVKSYLKICYNYLINWFIIDLIICFPYQILAYFFLISNNSYSIIFYEFVTILRFLKIFKLIKKRNFYFKIFQKIIKKNYWNKILYGYFILILNFHIINCLWFFTFYRRNYNIYDNPNYANYIISSYWTIQTIFTVGYGDYSANTPQSYLFFSLLMFIGTFLYTYTISLITNTVTNQNVNTIFRTKMRIKFNNLIKEYKFIESTEIYKKVNNFINSSNSIKSSIEDIENDLPYEIKEEFLLKIAKTKLKNVDYFQNIENEKFLIKIIKFVKEIILKKNEIIFYEGDEINEIYFIQKGSLQLSIYEILKKKEEVVVKTQESGIIGDLEFLFYNSKCRFTYKALKTTKLVYFETKHFYNLFIKDKKFQDLGEDFLENSKQKKIDFKIMLKRKKISHNKNWKTMNLNLLKIRENKIKNNLKIINNRLTYKLTKLSISLNKII